LDSVEYSGDKLDRLNFGVDDCDGKFKLELVVGYLHDSRVTFIHKTTGQNMAGFESC